MNEKDRIYTKVNSILREKGKRSSYIGEDDFVSLVKGGITIHFHLKNDSLEIENVFRTAKRAQAIFKDRFDHDIQELQIEIYDSSDEMNRDTRSKSRCASWIGGIYDGKVRLVSERHDEDPNAIYILLTHEIVHLGVFEMTAGRCPYWLDEGLAIYLSQELSDTYGERLRKAVRDGKIFPVEALEACPVEDLEEHARVLVYSQVFSITDYLVRSWGWEKVKSAVRQVRRRPIAAILRDFGLNYYLLEQGWKRWLRNNAA
jgi:hypothetical protein